MLHGNLYRYSVYLSLAVNDLRVERFFTSVKVSYEFADTTLVMENFLSFHSFSGIFETDLQTFCQECHLSQTLFQDIIVVYSFFENIFIRQEYNCCSRQFRVAVAYNFQRIHGLASFVSLLINFSLMIDFYFKPGRKCVYYRCTYSVESA